MNEGCKQTIEVARNKVRDSILTATGLRLDFVNSVCAKGGTSTDGKQARRFFTAASEPVLKAMLSKSHNMKHRDAILKLHNQLSIVLRIISCTRLINIEKYKQHVQDTMKNITTNFPWAKLNHTLHGAIQHSCELIDMNGGRSLGGYSEEGLEANNKDVRYFLEHLSRKSDSNKQLEDVHHRILERSDPFVCYITSKHRSNKICSLCKSKDHTIRSHDKCSLLDEDSLNEFFVQN